MENQLNSPAPSATGEAREAEARGYVRSLRQFYRLVLTAAAVIALTGTINYISSRGYWWFLWVVFGFAIAIAFSGINLLLRGRVLGSAWEERKVREYLDRGSQ
jgi:fatty acid desaturase